MAGVSRNLRDPPPSSYLLKVESFSQLWHITSDQLYESAVFEASGYKWRLVLYPGGNKKDGGQDHISLNVRIEHTSSLPKNWEVNVDLKLFIKNQTQNKFLAVQDGNIKRFNENNKELGFGKLLPYSTFNQPSNGYLVKDCCFFGAEIFVIRPSEKQETLGFTRNPGDGKFTWKIFNFSKLDRDVYESDVYEVGHMKWKITIHPKGYGAGTGNSLSMLLWCLGSDEDADKASPCVQFKLRLLDQLHSKNFEREYRGYYVTNRHTGRGDAEFIKLNDLNNPSRGFLVKDTLIAEADMDIVSFTNVLST